MSGQRESILPLCIAAALAVLAHLALMPAAARLLQGDGWTPLDDAHAINSLPLDESKQPPEDPPPPDPPQRDDEQSPLPPVEPPEPPEIPLGRDDAPPRQTVAWISHEDFQQLQAAQSTTEQPALQEDVTPTPDAPVILDPTPVALAAAPSPPTPPQSAAQSTPTQTPVSNSAESEAQPTEIESEAAPAPLTPSTPPVEDALERETSSQGPEPLPAPPIEQPSAESDIDQPPDVITPPINQERAVAPRESDGPPTQADPTPTPQDLAPAPAKQQTADAIVPAKGLDPFEPAQADDRLDTPPTDQPRAQTDEPADQGQPVTLDESQTPTPDDQGLPTQTTLPPTQNPNPEPTTQNSPPTPPNPQLTTPNSPPPNPQPRTQNAQRPTAAALADSEADPVSLTSTPVQVRPGAVLTGQGLTIKTARPDISVVSLLTAVPQSNPLAKIIFNPQGKVINVKMLKTTGYPDLDAPIEASLYKWQASGKKLEELDKTFSLEITLLLGRR